MSDDQRRDNKGETNGKDRHAVKPKTLYTDNGDEFNAGPEMANSAKQRPMPSVYTRLPYPRGRGKVEHLFRLIDPQLPNIGTGE